MEPSRTIKPREATDRRSIFMFRVYYFSSSVGRTRKTQYMFLLAPVRGALSCVSHCPLCCFEPAKHSEFHWSRNDRLENTINNILPQSANLSPFSYSPKLAFGQTRPLLSFRILIRLSNQCALLLALSCFCNLEVHTRIIFVLFLFSRFVIVVADFQYISKCPHYFLSFGN